MAVTDDHQNHQLAPAELEFANRLVDEYLRFRRRVAEEFERLRRTTALISNRYWERYGTRQFTQIRTSLKLGKNQQLDAHYGVGLTPAAVQHFVGIGYSFRFQVLYRE